MKKQQTKQAPSPLSSALIAAVGVLLVVGMIVLVVVAAKSPPPSSDSITPSPVMTLDATTVSNLTRMPNEPALSGAAAAPYLELQKMIESCPDFDSQHLLQMHQHLTWLLNPSEIPTNFLAAAFGTDPTGKLLFGMGSFAQNQWLKLGNKPGSCVVAVGKRINELLATTGEPTFKTFE